MLRSPTITISLVVVVEFERNSAHSTRKVLVLSRFSCDVGGRYTTARLTEELSITRLHIKYSNCTYFTTSFVLILRLFLYINVGIISVVLSLFMGLERFFFLGGGYFQGD